MTEEAKRPTLIAAEEKPTPEAVTPDAVLEKALAKAGNETSATLGALVALGLDETITFEGPNGSFTFRPKAPAVRIASRGGERSRP